MMLVQADVFLPSATKLRRLCFTGVCLSTGGGGWCMPCLAAGLQGGAIPACIAGGIPACLATGLQGGLVCWGCLIRGGGIPTCTEADPPPGDTATAADDTHPTGMHSFFCSSE